MNGFLVPPKSPEVMVEVILKLLDNNALREKLEKSQEKLLKSAILGIRLLTTF